METEQKGRLTEKIKQEVKMKKDKITCEQMKKPNAIKYFKSLNPFPWNITDLIASYKYAQTPEMLEFFKSLNPSEKEIKHMLQFYKKLRRKNLKKQ